jgi:tetratricopeptide (TPR) repeat protein
MDFQDTLQRLQQASNDPQSLALVTCDILLASRPESLRRAVEAAAVPHWFDAEILRHCLDPDLQSAAEQWYRQIVQLPFCERFPLRGGYNLHESTRLALRKRLCAEAPDRLRVFSGRAAEVFAKPSVHARIENAYQELWADPENAGPLIRRLEFDLRHKVEDALAFAVALHECITDDPATPPLVVAWAIWVAATVRAPYLTIQERLQLAQRMLALTAKTNQLDARAAASVLVGDALVEHGHLGDAEQALGHYQRSLEVRERLLAANPESAQAARDVSVSLNKLADFLAQRGLPGDAEQALGHYQRSLEVRERLLAANPESAQAARDVSVSLDGWPTFWPSAVCPATRSRPWAITSAASRSANVCWRPTPSRRRPRATSR